MTAILVTGGAGFIGANFVRYWRDTHPSEEIIVLDALTYAGNRASLQGVEDIDFVQEDIRNEAFVTALLRDRAIDTIVHFAAESHVDRSLLGPDAFVQTNVVGTVSLLNAAKKIWLDEGSGRPHRFHHISTDEVYGTLSLEDPAFHEQTPFSPNSPYSASKAASDHFVRAWHHSFGLETTTTNCSNNYGPYQFPEKLIPLFILNALRGEALPIYGDGMQIRDWLYVEDHCAGIGCALEHGKPGETYNIGGGEELANLTVIDTLCTAIDAIFENDAALAQRFPKAPAANGVPTASLKKHVTDRVGHDRRYAINDTKARDELGYRAAHPFDVRFRETLSWYIANEGWWSAILSGEYQNWIEANYTR